MDLSASYLASFSARSPGLGKLDLTVLAVWYVRSVLSCKDGAGKRANNPMEARPDSGTDSADKSIRRTVEERGFSQSHRPHCHVKRPTHAAVPPRLP